MSPAWPAPRESAGTLLEHLEQHAASRRARRILLETGRRNTAALALYNRAGYLPCPSYVAGRDPRVNRAPRPSAAAQRDSRRTAPPGARCRVMEAQPIARIGTGHATIRRTRVPSGTCCPMQGRVSR
ncbi:GNAT family N-acetyltransferase [Streptomyces microflavus]|uniref:GNAT family N-acetyltransferase n=1 Tax=Streptomyces microflavus TaxID=1919 RepID=UPI0033A81592